MIRSLNLTHEGAEIRRKGVLVCTLDGLPSRTIEEWIMRIRAETDAKVDWHFADGHARVLYLGDEEGRLHVVEAIRTCA